MTRVFSSCGEILVCLWADSRRVAVFSVCPQLVQRAPTDSLPNRAIDLQFAGKWQSCDPRLPGPVWTLLPSWLGYRSPDSGQNGMRSETRTNRCAFVPSHSRFRIVPPPPPGPCLLSYPRRFPSHVVTPNAEAGRFVRYRSTPSSRPVAPHHYPRASGNKPVCSMT